jgi:hypothetical protein
MSKGLKCSICTHPEALAIDSALESGVRQLTIAEQFAISKYALSRHVNRCKAPAASDGVSAGDQTDKWIARCDDLYLQAGVSGDLKSQIAALGAAIRALSAAQKQEEKRQEQERAIPTRPGTMTEREATLVHNYLDEVVGQYAWMVQTEREAVLALFDASLDEAGQAVKSQLREQLERHADCWLRLCSGIKPIDDSWRLLQLHFAEMQKQQEALQPHLQERYQ